MTDIDYYTKRKAPNAYVLFTTAYMNQYIKDHPQDAHRFQTGVANAIKDEMVAEAWQTLPLEDKQYWKDKAREEKRRIINEFSIRLEQYVSVKDEARPEGDANGDPWNPRPFGAGASMENGQGASSLRANSASLKRLLRPKKQRRKAEESKYAPSFFDEITTGKQFEEKRRRERNCLLEIWEWRSETNKEPILDESFFLVSSQPSGVRGDMHAPGKIACLEFTIRNGIKRAFCCNVIENYSDWLNGSLPGLYEEQDCNARQAPGPICRELGEWLRSTRKDLSSKTPVFFCLVDEYAETFDCLSILFNYKEGSSMRFQPYLLATTDDLVTALLQFFNVPSNLDGAAQPLFDDQPATSAAANARAPNETFPFSRVIDQFYVEMAKVHACDFHQSEIIDALDQNGGSGDGVFVEKSHRCPLAVVRTCAIYVKQWVESGRVDDRIQLADESPKSVDVSDEKDKSSESGAESMKSEDIDRFSYLNLSTGDGSDRTIGSGSEHGNDAAPFVSADAASDISDDIIEMNAQNGVGDQGSVVRAPVVAAQTTSVRSYTAVETSANSWSCASSRGSTVKRVPPIVLPIMPKPTASTSNQAQSSRSDAEAGAVTSGVGMTAEFRIMYDAQLRMPFGCRGLGRGLRFDLDAPANHPGPGRRVVQEDLIQI